MVLFWEPHSSSIDFCESNYLVSNYIVEVHNSWSSIVGLSSFGILGLAFNNHTREIRHTVAYSILVLIGLGSAGLHGTLHWFLQSSDELPMMYLLLSIIYLCAEWDGQKELKYPNLPTMLSLIAVVNTIIYYCLQKIYFVFVCTFISETALVGTWLYLVVYHHRGGTKNNNQNKSNSSAARTAGAAQRICTTGILSIILAAVPCWLFDMLHCQYFLDSANQYLQGVTPHIMWHFGAGFGAYCVILSLECCRLDELQIPYVATFQWGLFPRVATIIISTISTNTGEGLVSRELQSEQQEEEQQRKEGGRGVPGKG